MNVQKILAPTDLSPASERALLEALDLAVRFGAKVTVAYVHDLETIGAAATQEVEEKLMALRSRLMRPGIALDTRALYGDRPVAEVIVELACDEGFDLIVMGTHGRRGVRRAVMGSVAEAVVRSSRIPVLTVHAEQIEVPSAIATPRLL